MSDDLFLKMSNGKSTQVTYLFEITSNPAFLFSASVIFTAMAIYVFWQISKFVKNTFSFRTIFMPILIAWTDYFSRGQTQILSPTYLLSEQIYSASRVANFEKIINEVGKKPIY